MKSLFKPETHQSILNRIQALNENTQAQWGKMNVAQMLKHCQLTLEIASGNREMKAKGGFLKKIIFKAFKPMMYNNKPWKHNLGTAKELIITDSYIFETEKSNIVNLINEFVGKKEINNWPIHPLFGHFTTEQRGQMQYKHIDHHLTQFGV